MHKYLFYNMFIVILYMFRALLCSNHVQEYNKIIIKQVFVHYVGQLRRNLILLLTFSVDVYKCLTFIRQMLLS